MFQLPDCQKEGHKCLLNLNSCGHVYTATTNPLPLPPSSVLPGHPALLMLRTKSQQESHSRTAFIVPNVATLGGPTEGYLSADPYITLNSLLLKPDVSVATTGDLPVHRELCISHSTVPNAKKAVCLQKWRPSPGTLGKHPSSMARVEIITELCVLTQKTAQDA